MIVGTEKEISSMIVSGTASDNTMPINVPRTIPTMAPNVDTMIASQRTIRRVCRLVIPTARIKPISRVRSNTAKPRVIEIPSTAMMMANANSTVMMTSNWSICSACESLNWSAVSSFVCG